MKNWLLLRNTFIDYWDYANAVFYDASRAIARHGFTGFRYAWEHDSWGADFHCAILPVEYFFYLANLVMNQEKKTGLSLNEEIEILKKIQKQFGG